MVFIKIEIYIILGRSILEFRKDINGLRAFAVVAVVLFHFNESWMSGGFAGVDVFFVISGYLMTGIIINGIEKGRFSVIDFYLSRANRIIPALAVLCSALLLLGYFYMTTWDFKTLGRDVASSISFSSNIVFSLREGYFDVVDNFLLHTWTLSTEWQFYLAYPLALILLSKYFSLNSLKYIVLISCVVGFIYSVYSTNRWPDASYFLLPSRAWEMLIGALAFLYPLSLDKAQGRLLEGLGITLVVGSYFLISESVSWPGYMAILPVLGTFFVIQSQRSDSFITGNVIFQALGAWSYSIYLWHWPIAVAYRYYGISDKFTVLGLFLSVVIGFLSFKFIEKWRFKSVSKNKLLTAYILGVLFIGGLGVYVFYTQGVAYRSDLESNSLIQGGTGDDYIVHEGLSLLNTDDAYDYLLIGDSNANHYVRGILQNGSRVKQSWYADCMSFPSSMSVRNGVYSDWRYSCKNNYKIGIEEKSDIIISQSWVRHGKKKLECTSDKCFLTGDYYTDLQSQLNDLLNLYGKGRDIFIVGELPRPRNNSVLICLRTKQLLDLSLNCDHNSVFDVVGRDVNFILKEVASNYGYVYFIDPFDAVCKDDVCQYSLSGKSLFMPDGSHLSGFGSEVIWRFILSEIDAHKGNVDGS